MYCRGVNKQGKPCRAQAMANGWCYRHNPDIKQSIKALASARGGRKIDRKAMLMTYAPIDLKTPQGALDAITRAINDVRQGNIDAKTSNAIVQLIDAHNNAVRLADLEARLTAIEAQLNRQGA